MSRRRCANSSKLGEVVLSVPGPGVSLSAATAPAGGTSLAAQAYYLPLGHATLAAVPPAGRFTSVSVNPSQVSTVVVYAGPYGQNCLPCSGNVGAPTQCCPVPTLPLLWD